MTRSHPESTTLHAGEAGEWVRPRRLRIFLWVALVVLLLAAQTLLVALAFHYRSTRTQEAVEASAAVASGELAQLLAKDLQAMLAMPGAGAPPGQWRARAEQLLVARPELLRFERRDAAQKIVDAIDTRARPPLFGQLPGTRSTSTPSSPALPRGGAAARPTRTATTCRSPTVWAWR